MKHIDGNAMPSRVDNGIPNTNIVEGVNTPISQSKS